MMSCLGSCDCLQCHVCIRVRLSADCKRGGLDVIWMGDGLCRAVVPPSESVRNQMAVAHRALFAWSPGRLVTGSGTEAGTKPGYAPGSVRGREARKHMAWRVGRPGRGDRSATGASMVWGASSARPSIGKEGCCMATNGAGRGGEAMWAMLTMGPCRV